MKKIAKLLLLTLTLTLLCGVAVFAEEQSYKIDEIGVSFVVPEGTLGYTRDSGISDDLMKVLYGNDGSETHEKKLLDEMKNKEEYYVGYDANNNYRIFLKSKYSNIASLDSKSDEEIIAIVDEGFDGEYNQYGMTVDSKKVFTENERKFSEVRYHDDTGAYYSFATVVDHQVYYYTISVKATSGEVSDAYISLIKQIAGSSEFFEPVAVEKKPSGQTATNSSKVLSGDIFTLAVRILEVVVILVVVVCALVVIVGMLTGNKGGGRREVSYSTRRDNNYMSRLNRVMLTEEDSKKAKQQAEEAAKEAAQKTALVAELELEGMDEDQALMEADEVLARAKAALRDVAKPKEDRFSKIDDDFEEITLEEVPDKEIANDTFANSAFANSTFANDTFAKESVSNDTVEDSQPGLSKEFKEEEKPRYSFLIDDTK
ncbi:MAG: hypothetical protein E7254_04935 [Lachnospiraceae bacterium]|nr:hypothetical protein [Lachnospiraceae bacterium]